MELSERDCEMLDFEREWWRLPGRKASEIRVRFEMSSSTYYRTLHVLLDQPEAYTYDPLTVKRLIRRREQARRERIEGRRADPGSK